MKTVIRDAVDPALPFLFEDSFNDFRSEFGLEQNHSGTISIPKEKKVVLMEAVTNFIRGGQYAVLETEDGARRELRLVPRADVHVVRGGEVQTMPAWQAMGEAFISNTSYGLYPWAKTPREIILAGPVADDRWKLVFRTVPSNNLEGEAYDFADMGITFKQLAYNEVPQYGNVTGSQQTIPNLEWGAAMFLKNVWFEYGKIWKINEMLANARTAASKAMSDFFYGLLKNAGWTEDTWETSWIKTLNKSYNTLRRDSITVGTNNIKIINPGEAVVLMVPVEATAPILTALRLAQVVGYQGDLPIFPTAVVIDTEQIAASDNYILMIAPQKFFPYQEMKALYAKSDEDIMLDAQAWAWRYWNNGGILTTKAARKIKFNPDDAL